MPHQPAHSLSFRMRLKYFVPVLLGIIALLVLAAVVFLGLRLAFGFDYLFNLARQFDLNAEQNIPTYFSALLLLACAGLAAVAAADTRRKGEWGYGYWVGLAIGFGFMSVDEASSFHEMLNRPVRSILNTSGALYFAWVIPYGLVALLIGLAYARFLLRLPRTTRILLTVSGLIYLGGAVGVELLEGYFQEVYGFESLYMQAAMLLEETMEMLGLTLFIFAVLQHLQLDRGMLQITLLPAARGSEEKPRSAGAREESRSRVFKLGGSNSG